MQPLRVRYLGLRDYATTWAHMREFTDTRTPDTVDELWLLQHPPVFTQGQAGKAEHVLDAGDIPVVQADRGGQVTYHGPGQLIGYCLFDLRRLGVGVRELVETLEDALVDALAELSINAQANRDAHGVYVNGRKIASLGLRVRRGCSYHGFSLNIAMDLSPFLRINPCGYAGLDMVQVSELNADHKDVDAVGRVVVAQVVRRFGFEVVA